MALISCRECKQQISDSAGRCPSCGAKVKKPLSAIHWIGIIFLGVPCLLSVFAIFLPDPTTSGDQKPAASTYKFQLSGKQKYVLDWLISSDERTFIAGMDNALFDRRIQSVSAKDISRKYADNEVSADQEYKGKTLLLQGFVESIQSGVGDQPFLVLKGVNMFLGPQVKFKSPDIQRIASIRKGDKLRLVCVSAGEVIGKPFFDDCVFVEDYSPILKSNILDEIDGYLQSGNYSDEWIPGVVILTMIYANSMPDDSPCLSDAGKCEEIFNAKIPKNKFKELREQAVESLRSSGLSVPNENKGQETG